MRKRLLIVLMLIVAAPAVYAQGCAMCTKTASELDNKSAKGLNGGILYLAALPLAIMGTVGFIWWKHNKGH
ncbi:hypothetical protein [Polluticoccus soli]|uniref:hypothetical protein n=1 Tax=Polluticoccus soli TaxID=3034150 RepID=UPI0023E0A7EE|nr:hypothetical protein [Flavipsychrobacter sp. JY13-12]